MEEEEPGDVEADVEETIPASEARSCAGRAAILVPRAEDAWRTLPAAALAEAGLVRGAAAFGSAYMLRDSSKLPPRMRKRSA